ncbi:MAG: class I SAM-dependent methyltransferase [Pseudolabrys sp.]|jgi:SAM-dependent methyltransferase
MSLFYKLAYAIGFTPWENAAAHRPAAEQVAALFDREQSERAPPYGRALDLGCGTGHWTVDLALRGWQATGIELVSNAVRKARARARDAGVDVQFIQGDVTALRAAGVQPSFQFIWDFGTVHGLTSSQRQAVGREVTAVTEPSATMLMLAWAPGRRGPLPRGASRTDIEMAFPSWTIIDAAAFDVSGLPPPLRKVEPICYRLRRT